MLDRETHVIVGAGLAGAKAAEALRTEGFGGRIVLIDDEPERPYERPPLSKDYLRGESPREKAYVHPEGFYGDKEIQLRTGTVAESIDVADRELLLQDGERMRFDRLLLASGAEPRRLPLLGAELAGVHYLRDLADADRLKAALAKSRRLVVIGGGWIGAEVAASARQLGLEVAIIEPADVLLGRTLGPRLGEFYADLHRDHGVELHTGVSPDRLEGEERVERVRLHDGSVLDCDLIVVGIGVTPRTGLAEAAGVLVENGVIATKRLETSVPGIYAVGDVASVYHPFYRRRVRVEHWANALNQPFAAARAMLGKPGAYDRLPYFFSDQYDVGMEYTGDPAGSDELVLRGDLASREFVAFWLARGRVVAGMNVNVWDVSDDIKRLIRSRAVLDSDRLSDPEVALDSLAVQAETSFTQRRTAIAGAGS
jgi:3-phenylpropionate/trans-cinnamate dioxygenase ferredoxin reductase subunit